MKDNSNESLEEDLEETVEKENEKESSGEVIEWVKSIVIAIVIAVLIKTFIFNSTYVLGNSMHPTLHEKDRLFAMKISLYFSDPSRGEVVVISAPDDTNKDYIKRVVAIAGDKVHISDGNVYLNGEVLQENYIDEGSYTQVYDQDTWEVLEGQVFVLGDNRADGASKDSRIFGTVSTDSIKGITGFRYFPIDGRFGKINH